MKDIRIPIHSIVDVITNSSTVIYVGTHGKSVKFMTELIDTLLKVVAPDKRAEDFFTLEIVPNREHFAEMYCDRDDVDIDESLGWREQDDVATKIFDSMVNDPSKRDDFWDEMFSEGEDTEGYNQNELLIRSKSDDPININMTNKIQEIFTIEEGYN